MDGVAWKATIHWVTKSWTQLNDWTNVFNRFHILCVVVVLLFLTTVYNCIMWRKVKVLVAQWCPTLCDPMDCNPPGSSVYGRQEYWSGLPFPSPGNLPEPGIEAGSPLFSHLWIVVLSYVPYSHTPVHVSWWT